jgi:gliding motility-associated-like protein
MPNRRAFSKLRLPVFVEPLPERTKIAGTLFLLLFFLSLNTSAKSRPVADPGIVLTVSATAVSCYGEASGSITANVSGGEAPYQYSKDLGVTWQPDPLFGQLAAGSYTILARDQQGQQARADITLAAPAPLSASVETFALSCYDGGNGNIKVTASGGAAPYRYFMDNGPEWQDDAQFTGVGSGHHTIYIKDQHSCMIQVQADITAPLPLTVNLISRPVSCYGVKSGSITVGASGGRAPYQYSKDNGLSWQSVSTFPRLPSGDYIILVRDANGCVNSMSTTVGSPPELTFSTENTDINCATNVNGRIVIQAQGGTPPYKYSNNNGLSWQQAPDFQNISAGLYQLVVKDSNTCKTSQQVRLTEPPVLSLKSGQATFVSATDCSLTLAATGGTPPYRFSIDNGKTWQGEATFSHIPTGAYTARVADNNGCSTGLMITLSIAAPMNIVTDSWGASCNGAASAGFIVKAQDGTAPYRYSIDDGAHWQSQNSFRMKAGVYTLLAEDNTGKRGSMQISLGEPKPVITSAESTDVSCHGASNGVITAMASGGSGGYRYSINNGANWQSNPTFTGLPGGSYTLLARDRNGCGASWSLQLHEPAVLSNDIQSQGVSCYGVTDGIIRVSTTGGTPPYQYSLGNGSWQDTALFTQLPPGAYHLLVRDANGCSDSADIKIKEPLPLALTAGLRQVSCYGMADAFIGISAEGGTAPYLYSMNQGHWQSEEQFDGLPPGNFTMMVKDANGCTRGTEILITEPDPLALTLSRYTNACSYEGGQIIVNASGGTLPYQYTIADSNIVSADGSFRQLSGGNYQVFVTDKNNCTDTLSPIQILASPPLSLQLSDKTDMQCDGIHKGGITLEAAGGVYPYRYELNGKVISPGRINNLDNGPYTAIVTDQYDCKTVQQFDIILRNEDCELTMPTGFSPNSDGRNDIFRPALYGNIRQYQLQVFNSWGSLIFASNDPDTGWDGAFKGKQQPGGTYVWMVKYIDNKGETKIRRGAVTIVR